MEGKYEAGPLTLLRSEEHTSELQSQSNLVCRLLLEKKHAELATAFDHPLCAPVQVAVPEKQTAHLVDIDPGSLDPVTAKDYRVALLELDLVRGGLNLLPHADRAREAVLERIVGRFFGLDQPHPELPRRPRVVLGDELGQAVPIEVSRAAAVVG